MGLFSKIKKKIGRVVDPLGIGPEALLGRVLGPKGGGGDAGAFAAALAAMQQQQAQAQMNPFAQALQMTPQSFFQNPQAAQALQALLAQQGNASVAPTAPQRPIMASPPSTNANPFLQALQGMGGGMVPATPGPAPTGTTMMGKVGGFGNGGGKMTIPGGTGAPLMRFSPRSAYFAK